MDLETLDFKSTSMPDFPGTKGDGIINFAGFTGVDLEDGIVEFFITNFRPSVDRKGQVVPVQASVGCNATIEVFRLPPNTDRLQHVRTVADPAIATPNRVTVADRHGFYLTNDHGQHRKGWVRSFFGLLITSNGCTTVLPVTNESETDKKLHLPRELCCRLFSSLETSHSARTNPPHLAGSSQKATGTQMV